MEDLLDLAIESPRRASRIAERVLRSEAGPLASSYAHQCLGIVLRNQGRTEQAIDHLRAALRAAQSVRRPDRSVDIRATLGGTLVFAGRTTAGLRQLDLAVEGAGEDPSDELRAKVLMRKAGVLMLLGRYQEATPVARAALDGLQATGNDTWTARTRVWLAVAGLCTGDLAAAEREARLAEDAFSGLGAVVERLSAVELTAMIAVARGDLARGLRLHRAALQGYLDAGLAPRFPEVEAHAGAYLAAGLPGEAVRLLAENLSPDHLPSQERADYHLLFASALLATGDAAAAVEQARLARRMAARQRRTWFELRARLTEVRARHAIGDIRGLVREARTVAGALHETRADEAPVALTLAGRLAGPGERERLWSEAASYRSRPGALVRAAAWLARALEREAAGDRSGAMRACGAGLDAIDEHRQLLGSSELRALASSHGRDLTEVALRNASGDPRSLLRWTERTRATALALPPAASTAATVPAALAALRDNARRLTEARAEGAPIQELEKERDRLERAVRVEHHVLPGIAELEPRRAPVEEIVAAVGDGCLVELVDVDGVLHVLLVHGGRVRRRVAGTTAQVSELLGPAAMLMRRIARGRPADTTALGRRLQETILGDAERLIPDGPVVLSPTARLHGLAWSLLPALHDRPVSVVPSAGQWLRARDVRRPRSRRTVLVAGPRLATGGAEVPVLARQHPDAVLLDGRAARVEAVLEHLDGADLVHLAAHGHFRADSPLFSSLDLADGPLTVYELERLTRAPYRVVLSACESGVLAPVGAEELLGLAAALFSIGSAGLVSSVAEVNDVATAELMVHLHDGLARGLDPAAALLEVRRAAAEDAIAAGTAAAFVALGV